MKLSGMQKRAIANIEAGYPTAYGVCFRGDFQICGGQTRTFITACFMPDTASGLISDAVCPHHGDPIEVQEFSIENNRA